MVEHEPCVLIVDDEQSDLERIKKALASIRLRLLTVSDPHEVLRKVESELPDLVILDALLPGLSGFDLCKQIKTDMETKNTLVLILTGVYLKEHYRREAIHQFKADDFVTKPFRYRELQRLVLKLLAKKLQTSPQELQERLTDSKDILLTTELEGEKPGWFGRIFGRLKGAQAQTAQSGFLHSAAENHVGEELPQDEDEPPAEAAPTVEADEERGDEIVSESEEAEVHDLPEKAPEEVVEEPAKVPETVQVAEHLDDGKQEETAEPPSAPKEVVSEGAVAGEPKDEHETVAETEAKDEAPPPEPVVAEPEVEQESEKVLEKAPAETESSPPSDPEDVDVDSAKAVFEALGNDQEDVPETEIRQGDAGVEDVAEADGQELAEPVGKDVAEDVVEDVEESVTERTIPAGLMATADEIVEHAGDAEEAEAAHGDTPESPPRPKALHEELPIYQEEDYFHELKREVSMCDRLGRPITLIMVRIADLDQIVELLGRQFRSRVLLHVAEHALEALREIDMVGLLESKELIALTAFASDRYGGEKIVSRLQTVVGHNPFEVGVGLPSFIPDLRFGMAVFPKDAAGMEEMLECAEAELAATRRSD